MMVIYVAISAFILSSYLCGWDYVVRQPYYFDFHTDSITGFLPLVMVQVGKDVSIPSTPPPPPYFSGLPSSAFSSRFVTLMANRSSSYSQSRPPASVFHSPGLSTPSTFIPFSPISLFKRRQNNVRCSMEISLCMGSQVTESSGAPLFSNFKSPLGLLSEAVYNTGECHPQPYYSNLPRVQVLLSRFLRLAEGFRSV